MTNKTFFLSSLTAIIIVCLIISSCQKQENRISLNNISYHVPVNDPNGYGVWWKMNIEKSDRTVFTKQLFESAVDGSIPVYDSVYQALTTEQVKERNQAEVQFQLTNPETLEEYDSIVVYDIGHEDIASLHYKENWLIDTTSFMIEKQIEGFCPVYEKRIYETSEGGQYLKGDLYWFNHQSGKGKKTILTKLIAYDIYFLRYSPAQMGIAYSNMSIFEEYAEKLVEAVYSNKIKAYEFLPGEFAQQPIEGTKLKSLLDRDIIITKTNIETLEEYDSAYTQVFNPEDITGFRFLEEWSVNTKSMEIDKKVFGICPLESVLTDEGELKGNKPLFWVYFDEENPKELINKFGL